MAASTQKSEKEKHIVRLLGTDLNGDKSILYALPKIKGVKYSMANAVCQVLKIDKTKKIKELSEKELEAIEKFLLNPKGIPSWLFNKRKDYITGEDHHLVTKDLEFNEMQIRRRLFKIKCYRGIRLKAGLPVRGQRTKSNFRPNKRKSSKKKRR